MFLWCEGFAESFEQSYSYGWLVVFLEFRVYAVSLEEKLPPKGGTSNEVL